MARKKRVGRCRAVAAEQLATPRYPRRSVLDLVCEIVRFTFRPGGLVAPPSLPLGWLELDTDDDEGNRG